MNWKFTTLVLCFFISTLTLSTPLAAQEIPLFTQYSQYQTFINPASIPNEFWAYGYNLQVGGSFRQQWANLKYSPKSAFFKADYITARDDDSALLLGGQFISDETGPTGFNGFYGRVGSVIGDIENWGISGGLNIGWIQHQFNTTDVFFVEEGDVNSGVQLSRSIMDIGGGVYFYKNMGDSSNVNTFYAGISIPQLGFDVTYKTDNELISIDRSRHFFAVAGYFKEFEDAGFLEINTWAKYVEDVPINLDLNLRYQFKLPFWLGIGGSTNKSVHLEAGVALRDLLVKQGSVVRIGYSMDRTFGDLGPNFGPSHEFHVAVLLNTNAKNQVPESINEKEESDSTLSNLQDKVQPTTPDPEKEKKPSKKASKKDEDDPKVLKPGKKPKKEPKEKKSKQEKKQEKVNKRKEKLKLKENS